MIKRRWIQCLKPGNRIGLVPDNLLRMIDDYLSDWWVVYQGDKWSLKEEMTCGAPQGLRVGPLILNVMYDDFLRIDLPTYLELRINENMWRAKRCFDFYSNNM